jgi:steroid 5-alpha reductase family enzyme
MSIWIELAVVWCFAAVFMSLGWLWQRRRRNAGIVDVIWAGGLAVAAVWLAVSGDGAILPRAVLGVLGSVWGGRLALHLWARVSHEAEDGRYRYLREHWRGSQLKFFAFFQFQAFLVVLFALPFAAVAQNSHERLSGWTVLGLTIWVVSVVGESVADAQLARFRANPANKGLTCRVGLWRYSRHPNYFFEWLHWLTYVALAIGSPILWLAAIGPVLMYVFLRWVSGIPFTEAQALRTRGEDYRLYQRQTSRFFPWFPKRASKWNP